MVHKAVARSLLAVQSSSRCVCYVDTPTCKPRTLGRGGILHLEFYQGTASTIDGISGSRAARLATSCYHAPGCVTGVWSLGSPTPSCCRVGQAIPVLASTSKTFHMLRVACIHRNCFEPHLKHAICDAVRASANLQEVEFLPRLHFTKTSETQGAMKIGNESLWRRLASRP